jgi:YegS/Rv2252/BmrU family lipid kinase
MTSRHPDTLLIVNPVAGRGRALKALPCIESALAEMGIRYEKVLTAGPGDATRIASDAAARGFRTVACVGGDGTVSETGRGLIGTETRLALLPAGSGNDFARLLGIYRHLPRALRALRDGTACPVDVGKFGPHTFLNTLGLGYAGVVTEANQGIQRVGGRLSYLAAVLRTLPTYVPTEFHLKARDWEFRGKGIMVELGNGRCSGGGFFLTPGANPRDGLLDVTLLGNYNPVERFVALPLVFVRRMHWLKGVRFFRADVLQVSVDRPTLIHVDGNLETHTGCAVAEILPAALRVLFPKGWPDGVPGLGDVVG